MHGFPVVLQSGVDFNTLPEKNSSELYSSEDLLENPLILGISTKNSKPLPKQFKYTSKTSDF